MKSGFPLTDEDREGWLGTLNKLAKDEVQKSTVVISCSALKESYRQRLQKDIEEQCDWVYLKGDYETISKRINNRTDHFMPAHLLQSQFDTLEEPKYGFHINIKLSAEKIIQKIIQKLNHKN